jgi:hypothetical protein
VRRTIGDHVPRLSVKFSGCAEASKGLPDFQSSLRHDFSPAPVIHADVHFLSGISSTSRSFTEVQQFD